MDYIKESQKDYVQTLKHILSIPFIYGAIIPLVVLDLGVEIYHRICFPLYNIDYVPRKRYIKFDRVKLPYLSPLQKFNCAYCSYGNGLIKYVSEVLAETERYWCGIKHEEDEMFIAPTHHEEFVEYGDEKAYLKKYN